MDYEIEFGGDPQDVTIRFVGAASAGGIAAAERAVGRDPRDRPGLRVLVDLSGVDASLLSDAEMQKAAVSVLEHDWTVPRLAVALVAPDEQTFAAATRWRAHLGGSASRREVFRTRGDALAWLAEQPRRPSRTPETR